MNALQWWQPEMQQGAFRAVLNGFARPGTLAKVGDSEANAALVLLATLLDESVTLADPFNYLNGDQRRLLLAPDAPLSQARFVLRPGALPPAADFEPARGTLESPEFGVTLVLTVDDLSVSARAGSTALRLSGPGIEGERVLHVAGLHPVWLSRRADWVGAYPLGVDLVLCAADRLTALPRTTRIHFERD